MSKPDNTIPIPSDDERRDAATQRIADYVTVTLAAAPPLTDDQRRRLAELLRPVRQPSQGASA